MAPIGAAAIMFNPAYGALFCLCAAASALAVDRRFRLDSDFAVGQSINYQIHASLKSVEGEGEMIERQ
jgi:hypothetical protein